MKRKDIVPGRIYSHINHPGVHYMGIRTYSGKLRMIILRNESGYVGTYVITKGVAGKERVKEFYRGFRTRGN